MLSLASAESHPGEDASDVLARADLALYEAKSSGRNQLLTAA